MKKLKNVLLCTLLTITSIGTQFLLDGGKKVEAITKTSTSISVNQQASSTYPSKVKNLKTASKTSTSIKIKWDKVNKASGYVVYRATSKSGKYSKIATLKNNSTTSYNNKNLKANKKYYYKVKAYKKVNSKTYYGSYSNILSTCTNKSYMSAYKKFLDENSYLEGEKVDYFFTQDLDNDGVKELLVVDKTERSVKVYTYTNNSVKYCGDSYDRGIVYLDKSKRLARRFNNSAEHMYYYLTLNNNKKLSIVSYTYDKIDKKYYKETGLLYRELNRKSISESTFYKAIEKADFYKNIVKYSNTSANRAKYLK